MNVVKKIQYIIPTLLLVVVSFGILATGWDALGRILFPKRGSWIGNMQLYQWITIGIILFFAVKRLLKENLKWFETFTHELTHTIVAILFFRRIHSFEANDNSGQIMSSGSDKTLVFIDLAPYCLPLYTYILLVFRAICSLQIGSYQTDINKRPLYFSYTYIATALLFNLCVLIVSYWSSKNVFTAFWYVVKSVFEHLFIW